MIAYAVRRLVFAVSMVWAVSFLAFVSFGLSFDPLWQYALCTQPSCLREKQLLIVQFHLHDPILERYWIWFSGLFHHGFGMSAFYYYGGGARPIGRALWPASAVTAQLMAAGLLLTLVFSVVVGVVSARRPGSVGDLVLRLLAYVAWSMPTFLTGVLLVKWLVHPGLFYAGAPGGGFVRWFRTMTLPAVTLSLGLVGLYSRYVRTGMLTALRQPYAVVARAKGLSEARVAYRHALRNSLIPFVSVLSLEIGAIVGASLAADFVFGMGGLADVFLGAISQADPFTLTAVVVVVACVVAVFTLLSDLLVGWLDPRVRAAKRD